jgi:hypothetical protein
MKQLGALVVGLMTAGQAAADVALDPIVLRGDAIQVAVPKSASANTVASRGFVSASQTLYGGFSLAAASRVYILVRGNSLGTLGVTQSFLDLPRVRLFDQSNNDLIFGATSGAPGSNTCNTSDTSQAPVVTYYQSRGAVQQRDFCIAVNLAAGVYTFTVTPSGSIGVGVSSPSSGEVLFEVTLGP